MDGVEESTTTGGSATAYGAGSGAPTIGRAWRDTTYNLTYLDGKIDDVRIYDRSLSVSEVQDLYNLGVTDNDLTTGLVGHWNMDDGTGSGTAADISGNSNDGTLTNMDAGTDWVSGKIGGALDFDGSNDYVNLGNPAELQITGAMTVSMWINPNDSAEPYLFSKMSGDRGYDFSMNPGTDTSVLEFRIGPAGSCTSIISSGATPEIFTTGQWYHVVGVYEPSTALRVYVNGVEEAVNTTSIPAASCGDNANNVHIGRRADLADMPFNGKIDDVRVYNRALSPGEIQALYLQKNLCSNPEGIEGELAYNTTHEVLQWCGGQWRAAGPVPGSGGAGCSNPAGSAGDMIYNTSENRMQYCEGTDWIMLGAL